MFCSKCGNELKENDIFCNKCGEKVVKEQQNNIRKVDSSNNIDSIIENMINGINDVNYKGIFLFKNMYILTDGFRIITFKSETDNKRIIEKYKIQSNNINQKLNFNFDETNNIEIKIDDIDKIKEHISLHPKTPYIIKYNDKEYGVNPEYLIEAMELTKSNSIWVSDDTLKTYLVKGEKYNYYILPIKLNNSKNYNNTNNMKAMIKTLLVFLIIGIGIFLFYRNMDKNNELRVDKSAMLNSLQKYVSNGVLTVEDLDVDQVEKQKTYTIYKVKINRDNVLSNSYIYVGLIKPTGNYTEYVVTGNNLSSVYEKVK